METKNKNITSRDVDFAKWYTDIVTNTELADYSSVKGCLVIKPRAYAIWENIQKGLDTEFKRLGHENVYMPMFIPESLLNKEKQHVEGFAPEVAWVTHGGSEELQEKLCVRPTSETLFCEHYAKNVTSYRDLPKLYNQWCSVVRWEKTTRPFLRSREFLWQEGHTVHATKEEAVNETLQMLDVYANFVENVLAIPVIKGRKTEKEKFAGAEDTYTIEALMYNGVSLQSATSHYFGQNFSIPFDIKFTDKENKVQYVHQTSWGASTRLIGGLIMVHGDDNGLVIPPRIAPLQTIIIPIGSSEEVLNQSSKIREELLNHQVSSKIDFSEKSPGFKFAEHEMNGVPVRIEIGPRDLENQEVTIARRDNGEKIKVKNDETLVSTIIELLETIQKDMFERAKTRNTSRTYQCTTIDEIKHIIASKPGYIKTGWCGETACEIKMKEEAGVTSRCVPFDQEPSNGVCPVCGKPSKHTVIWGIQY